MTAVGTPEARIRRLVSAARRLADPKDALGASARRVLPESTGLSPEGVALALEHHLETHPTDAEMEALLGSVRPAPRAHVILSANVFTAAHRALALALAASDDVLVKPSRREPEMVRLLAEGAEGLFRIVPRVEPSSGDHVFVYGSDEAIREIRAGFPVSVVVHEHGAGLGVVVVDVSEGGDLALEETADAIAADVVPFDQRGCLSPRVVLAVGGEGGARALALHLSRALERRERVVPRGRFGGDELAAVARYRDTLHYAGEVFQAGSGLVGLDLAGRAVVVPPVGRHLHVVRTTDLAGSMETLRGKIVALSASGPPAFGARAHALVPEARLLPLGRMQTPPFDGPVDGRSHAKALEDPS